MYWNYYLPGKITEFLCLLQVKKVLWTYPGIWKAHGQKKPVIEKITGSPQWG